MIVSREFWYHVSNVSFWVSSNKSSSWLFLYYIAFRYLFFIFVFLRPRFYREKKMNTKCLIWIFHCHFFASFVCDSDNSINFLLMISHIVSYLLFDDCQKDSIAQHVLWFEELEIFIQSFLIEIQKREMRAITFGWNHTRLFINPIDFFCLA